uniref:Uncharacterized protein n=1 Tax=Panagrolaimus sp. PS1159 TaxID=55785 RepID=A0AC35GB51_9BILA
MKADNYARINFFKQCYIEKQAYLYMFLIKESRKLDNIIDRWTEFFCFGKNKQLLEDACDKTTPIILINVSSF